MLELKKQVPIAFDVLHNYSNGRFSEAILCLRVCAGSLISEILE